jgi:hypothetical protein
VNVWKGTKPLELPSSLELWERGKRGAFSKDGSGLAKNQQLATLRQSRMEDVGNVALRSRRRYLLG